MGEAPPYTLGQLNELLKGARVREIVSYTDTNIVIALAGGGNEIEFEIDAQAHRSDDALDKPVAELTAYVRGLDWTF